MDIVYNWHITEHCNYSCDYCFAKWGKPEEVWKHSDKVDTILSEIKAHGGEALIGQSTSQVIRINFAGGEPLLLGEKLIRIIKKAKESGFKTSIITNASLLQRYIGVSKYIDMLGISIDSFVQETNLSIGRSTKSEQTITFDYLSNIVSMAKSINPDLDIKFNVVVNRHNFSEILIPKLKSLNPKKIKVLRELSVGQNVSALNDVMFKEFIQVNRCGEKGVVVEDNEAMTRSYLMIDPMGRLYQNGDENNYTYSDPIHNIGLQQALKSIKFNPSTYRKRYMEVSHAA